MARKKSEDKESKKRMWPMTVPVYIVAIVLILILIALSYFILNYFKVSYEVKELDTEVKTYVYEEPYVILEPVQITKTGLVEKDYQRLVPIPDRSGLIDTKTDCYDTPYDYTVEYLGDLKDREFNANWYTGWRRDIYTQSIRVCNLESFQYEPLQMYFDVCYFFDGRNIGCSGRRLFIEVWPASCKVYYNLVWETEFDSRKDIKVKVLNVSRKKICNKPLEFSYNENILSDQDVLMVKQCSDEEFTYSIDYVADLENLEHRGFLDYPERTGYEKNRYYQYAYICNHESNTLGPLIAKFNVCLFYNDSLVECNSQLTMRVPGTGVNDVDPCRPTEDLIYETSFNKGKDIRLIPVDISKKKVCKIVPGYDRGGIRYKTESLTKKVPVTYYEKEYRNITRYRNVTKTYESPYIRTEEKYRTLWEDIAKRFQDKKDEEGVIQLKFP